MGELPFNIRAINRGRREYWLGSFNQQKESCASLKWLDFGTLLSFREPQHSHWENGVKIPALQISQSLSG